MSGEKIRDDFLEWADLVRKHYSKVKGIHDMKFRPFQEKLINTIAEGKNVNIIAPPGFGKSLPLFIAHSFYPINYGLKSTYTVPTNSLMSSIIDNFIEVIENINPSYIDSVGYVRVFDSFNLPRKILFMNTVTQYALIKFKVNIYDRRFLVNSVGWFQLIQDEIHFYLSNDNIMKTLKNYVKEYSKHYPVIISSATLPQSIIRDLEKEGWQTIYADPLEVPKTSRLTNITLIKTNMKQISNTVINILQSLSISKTNKVIIFLNTRVLANEVYYQILSTGEYSPREVILLTSEIPAIVRKQFEEELKNENSNIKIIISTQVAEVGIDNSAIKYVITQLSPLDSLVQRVGRIRLKRTDGEVFILDTGLEDTIPYNSWYIEKTLRIISNWDYNTWNKALIDSKWLSYQLDKIFPENPKKTSRIDVGEPVLLITPINYGLFLAYIYSHDSIISDDIEYIDTSNVKKLAKLFKQFIQLTQKPEHEYSNSNRALYGVVNNALKFAREYCGVQVPLNIQEAYTLLKKIIKEFEKTTLLSRMVKYYNIEKISNYTPETMAIIFNTYMNT